MGAVTNASITRMTPLLVLVCVVNYAASATYSGGDGTAQAPYRLASAAELIALSATPADWNKHFVLIGDIDLAPGLVGGRIFDRAVIAPDTSAEQEGFQGPTFTGVFDGAGHAIRNLTVRGGSYTGLFGTLGDGAGIRDLAVLDADVDGAAVSIGILAGENRGDIADCSASGIVTGERNVGGLVGQSSGRLVRCWSDALAGSGWCVGGLAGWNDGEVLYCHSSSAVLGRESIGGLIGQHYHGAVAHSCSTGIVAGQSYVGGLVGSSWAAIINCYAAGQTIASWYTGGLVGLNASTITNCYSAGRTDAGGYVGGLVGANYGGSAANSYSRGAVTGSQNTGGLVGDSDNDAIVNSFWDIETSGQSDSDGGTGLSTSRMQDIQTYTDAGWDLVGRSQDGTCEVWQAPAASGYPVLAIFQGYTPPALSGSGTAQEPYRILNAAELGAVYYCDLRAYFRVAGPIDLSGVRWSTAVIPFFAGTFDGEGLTISNLTIQGGTYLGLFGQLGPDARISHVALTGVSVGGSGAYIGALAGRNDGGQTASCHSAGTIHGNLYVGGLLGYNAGSVTNVVAEGTVDGNDFVGGIAGQNNGRLDDSAATVEITGREDVGGLVGYNSSDIRGCRSSGAVWGDFDVGGLVGDNYAWVSDCNSTGPATGLENIGGLIGINNGTIIGSSSVGAVVGEQDVGGLAGDNSGGIHACADSGPVSGRENVGGLVGHNSGEQDASGPAGHHDAYCSVIDSCSTGAVSGDVCVGGLVGDNAGRLVHCYSTGRVAGRWKDVGGLVGYTDARGSVTGCFWDIQTSGLSVSDGGTGLATSSLLDRQTYLDAAWDLAGEAANGLHETWRTPAAGGYPMLSLLNGLAPSPPAGRGTPEDPYRISTAAELAAIVYLSPKAGYRLAADIDLAGITWSMAPIPQFEGTFDGGGFTIRNLTISGAAYLGLFGRLANQAQVTNLAVRDATVTGTGNRIGILAGHNQESSMSNCRSTGDVNGYDCVGGLAGSSYYGAVQESTSECVVSGRTFVGGLIGDNIGSIADSSTSGTVCGDDHIGGLAGFNEGVSVSVSCSSAGVYGRTFVGGFVGSNWLGVVTNSYATGDTTGRESVGGFAGQNLGSITWCYGAGGVTGDIEVGGFAGNNALGSITACFWDTQTSGRANMCGTPQGDGPGCDNSRGKGTAQMHSAATFLAAGWDFVGETANGRDDFWWIREGQDYPRLFWQAVR